jgi:hypothetical protein
MEEPMRIADHCPMPGLTLDDALWRAEHFDICTCACESYALQMRQRRPGIQLAGYLQPTRGVSWTDYIYGAALSDLPELTDEYRAAMAAGCKRYMIQYGFDSLFVDEPFTYAGNDWRRVLQLVVTIENAIAPAHSMVNFGDYGTYAASMSQNPLACQIAGMFKQHFVQVAVDTTRFDLARWNRTRDVILNRANGGKLVVVGTYDPAGAAPWLARGLDLSIDHPNVVSHYHTATSGVGRPETQWNPHWETP